MCKVRVWALLIYDRDIELFCRKSTLWRTSWERTGEFRCPGVEGEVWVVDSEEGAEGVDTEIMDQVRF